MVHEDGTPIFRGSEDVTQRLCGAHVDCTEAIATDGVTFYKFGNRNDAAAFSRSLGSDGYQSDWIVVEFTDPAFTAQDRQMLGGFVDDLWGSD